MSDDPKIQFMRDRLGNSVAYAVQGEGPLLICPVWWVSHVEKDWGHDQFRRFFERLGRGMRLVRYDRPGVGLSDRDVAPRTLADEVALLEDLATELGEPSYDLFAISCGGPIAMLHAAAQPHKVSRICFYGSFVDGQSICSGEVQNAVLAVVRAHWGLGSRALADIFFPDETRETLDAFARQARDAATASAAEALLKLTYSMKADAGARQVGAECLVIHRTKDRAIPYECGRQLASRLASARLVSLEGTAHPPWLRGDEVADLANDFLRRTDGAKAKSTNTQETAGCDLDAANRCLRVDGGEVALTPLEFGVMRVLVDAEHQVVTRDQLLEAVWKQSFEGSNKIDVVISALRRKLGPWAASIETVIGHGYRFSAWRRV